MSYSTSRYFDTTLLHRISPPILVYSGHKFSDLLMKSFFQNHPPLFREFLIKVLVINIVTIITLVVIAGLLSLLDLGPGYQNVFSIIYPPSWSHAIQIHFHLTVYFAIYFSLGMGCLLMILKHKSQALFLLQYLPLAFILGALQHYYVWWISEPSCSMGSCYDGEEAIILIIVLVIVSILTLGMFILRYLIRQKKDQVQKLDKIIAFPLAYLTAAGPLYFMLAIFAILAIILGSMATVFIN